MAQTAHAASAKPASLTKKLSYNKSTTTPSNTTLISLAKGYTLSAFKFKLLTDATERHNKQNSNQPCNKLEPGTQTQQVWPALTIWFLLVGTALVVAALNTYLALDLRFVREHILAGEVWRIISGHISHASLNHLLLNAGFLALLLFLFQDLRAFKRTVMFWLTSCSLISAAMLILSPSMNWYVGLSASLYTLLIMGISFETSYTRAFRALLVTAVVLKVALEQGQVDSAVSAFIAAPVAEISHAYGVGIGLLLTVARLTCRRLLIL